MSNAAPSGTTTVASAARSSVRSAVVKASTRPIRNVAPAPTATRVTDLNAPAAVPSIANVASSATTISVTFEKVVAPVTANVPLETAIEPVVGEARSAAHVIVEAASVGHQTSETSFSKRQSQRESPVARITTRGALPEPW